MNGDTPLMWLYTEIWDLCNLVAALYLKTSEIYVTGDLAILSHLLVGGIYQEWLMPKSWKNAHPATPAFEFNTCWSSRDFETNLFLLGCWLYSLANGAAYLTLSGQHT